MGNNPSCKSMCSNSHDIDLNLQNTNQEDSTHSTKLKEQKNADYIFA